VLTQAGCGDASRPPRFKTVLRYSGDDHEVRPRLRGLERVVLLDSPGMGRLATGFAGG